MKTWPIKKLRDIALIQMGQSPPGDTYNSDGLGLPFFQGKAEFGEEIPRTVKWCSKPLRVAEAGDILLSVRAPVGPTNFAAERCCIGRGLAAIRADPKVCNQRYLRYYLKRFEADITARGVGSTFSAINRNDIEALEVPIPPLAEQDWIVRLLDEADELRKLRTKANRRIAELIPALFNEMFGELESEESYKVRLGEIAEVKSGAGFPLARQGRLDQPFPFFKVGDMNTQGNEWAMRIFQHTISETTRKELGAALLPANSVIFPKVGAAIGTNKKRIIACPSCVDNNVMAIIPSEKIITEFLLASLGAKNLLDFASNSNPPSIRKTTIEDWRIMHPPLSQQKEFAARVSEIRMLEAGQAASRLRLEALFQSFLHRAFQGDL